MALQRLEPIGRRLLAPRVMLRLASPLQSSMMRGAVAQAAVSSRLPRRFSSIEPVTPLDPKVFAVVEAVNDAPGVLATVLGMFGKHNINLTNIESRFKTFARDGPSFHIDFEGTPESESVQRVLRDIKALPGVAQLTVMPEREVPWFPLNIRDLDDTIDTLDGGTGLINEAHPGFKDKDYRKRREEIAAAARTHRYGDRLPRVNYSEQEVQTWCAVYEKLQQYHKKWACQEFLDMIPQMERHCGYAPNNIPQLEDISAFLQQRTGFVLRPISGLLSARDFLNALAFRVFYSTQYIRHHGNPFYTPEPDVCHELLGHVPLFANPAFADFSQEIGLASLAASDDDIARLAAVYWFTVEFGLVRQNGHAKAFGAGLLSSFGEIEWACADNPSKECRESGSMSDKEKPDILPLDPTHAGKQPYPITTYQPLLYCADSLDDAKRKIKQFCDTMARPFYSQYDPLTQNIKVPKSIRRAKRISTVEMQARKQQEYFSSEGGA